MRRMPTLAVLGALVLAGCGSQTKTVSISSAPPGATTTTAASAPTTTAQAPPVTTTTTAPPSTGPSTTRTAPEPSFAESGGSGKEGSVQAAVATVRSHGYTPANTSEYHRSQTLQVLVGTRTGSGDGYGQQAFFFLDGHYLGTDTKEPSAKLAVVSQGDTEIAIAYPLYRRNDPLCCPGGGQRVVHFALNNGKLQALDPIPPASGYANLSRY